MEKSMDQTKQKLFLGRLGKEPDLRYTKKQKPVCYFTVASTNEIAQKTDWHKVVVWGKQAELCKTWLKKGSEVFVHGREETKEFTTSEGEQKKYDEVTAYLIGFPNV
jgi:single-strand DNA-binding protein